jgi:hypothetical protein
MVKIHL